MATSRSDRRRELGPAFDVARAEAASGRVPFAILGVADAGGVVRLEAFPGPDAPSVGSDAVCLVASITKPIVATAVMRQVEAGRIGLHEALGEWSPSLVNPAWAPITPWHVLTHTSGIADIDLEDVLLRGQTRSDLIARVIAQPQETPPGTTFRYASFTFDLLGEALAARLGRRFEDLVHEDVLEPLGLAATTFDPAGDPALAAHKAPILLGGWDGPPIADPRLELAFTSLHLAGGGLWSTAGDLLRFGRAMLRGGELDGVRVLSRPFLDLMTCEVTASRRSAAGGLGSQPDPLEADHYALGWGKPGMTSPASDGAFAHDGASGTRLRVDPAHDLVLVYLTGCWGLPSTRLDVVENAVYASLP